MITCVICISELVILSTVFEFIKTIRSVVYSVSWLISNGALC